MLPFTLPSTTTSLAEMLACTWPFRPIVTRLPSSVIEPSTLPSIYKDSDPVSSPLMIRLLPIVACSFGAAVALLAVTLVRLAAGVGSKTGAAGAAGRVGSLLGVGVAPAG